MPDNVTSFRQLLETKFAQEVKEITIDVSFGEEVTSLLQLLNQQQLTLTQTSLDPPLGTTSPSQSSLIGKVRLWEIDGVDITLVFSEHDRAIAVTATLPQLNFPTISRYLAPINSSQVEGLSSVHFPQSQLEASTKSGEMIVTGKMAENWSLLGIERIGIEKPELMLKVQTHPELLNNYVVEFTGKIHLSNLEIPVSIDIPLGIGGWSVTILPPGIALPSLTDLLELMSGLNIAASLPSQVGTMTALTLTSMRIQFDPNTLTWQGTDFSITSTNVWEIAPKLRIETIGLTLNLRSDGSRVYYTGFIFGSIQISRLTLAAMIPLPLSGLLTLEVHSNQPLPGLGELAALIDADYAAALPEGMGNIGSMILNYVRVQVDLDSKKIAFFGFDVASAQEWVIIPNHLSLEDLRFRMEVIPWNQGWGVTGFIGGSITIEGIRISTALQRINPAGGWYLWLAEPLALPGLKGLVNLVGGDYVAGLLPPQMDSSIGALTINTFSMVFDGTPQTLSAIAFSMVTSEPWQFLPGYFTLTELDISLDITQPTNPSQRRSQVSIIGLLTLGNIPIRLSAEKPSTDGAGWQFKGSTGKGREIPVGYLISDLGETFGVTVPSTIEELTLDNIEVSFNTQTRDFFLTCEGKFPLEDKTVDIIVTIELNQQSNNLEPNTTGQISYQAEFKGHITIGTLTFDLIFAEDKTSKTAIATYSHQPGNAISLKVLVENVSSDQTLLDILTGIQVDLKDVLFAYSKRDTTTKILLGFDIGTNINLSKLPLVGQEFPKDQTIGVDDLQFLIANKDFTSSEITTFNNLIEQGTKIPIKDSTANALPKGLNVAAKMQFGSQTNILALPISSSTPQTPTPSQPTVIPSTTTPPSDNATWFKIQKSFGPVHFERVGVQYKDAAIGFLLDASLNLAGLSLSLDGLAVNSPLNQFDPKFELKGIGIDYKGSDTLEIGGAFLRTKITTQDGKTYDEYDGAAVIKFNVKGKALKLSAIGSYAYFQGHPSLFIYAILDYPIGGPSFFFVTGLAAGFGYNRALKVPTIDQVATFPLVAEAVNPPPAEGSNSDQAARLTGELTKLRDYIPPETGQIFLAIGIKFTSFKLIDSFLLLTVAFGNRFELNILGLATLIAPPNVGAGVPPVAEVQLALKASFLPAEGFIGVIAQLTPNSYILSQACHLTGGFAFYGWFAPNVHEGDFVLTLGGYHPLFKVPDHYPKVPRLGLNWQVSSELYIKADAYFALTPSAIMAGGHLQATWNSGPLSAWFNAGADFLMSWKPYHYDISIYIDMGVSYTFQFFGTQHITVQLGADLHIWGPEFTGIAHIHLWIISFDVSFGSSASQAPTAIDWNEFKTSFLPAADAICTIAVKEGLVRKVNQDDKTDLGNINPKDFCLVTNSVIPIKTCNVNLNTQEINTQFGIGSMAVTASELISELTITINKNGTTLNSTEFDEDFACIPLFKKVPIALWGESLTPSLNGNQFIENTLSGLEIKPKKQPDTGATKAINRSELQFSTTPINNAYHWQTIGTFQEETTKDIRNTIVDNAVNNTRDNLLKALNLNSEEIDLNSTIADDLLGSPKIEFLAN